jgi:hypothetical protein
MRLSLRRRSAALACAGLVSGLAGLPVVAHAAKPGAAEGVSRGGMCGLWWCEPIFDFVMAPPTGTLQVDWGDGTSDTYTPGTAEFEVHHLYADINTNFPSYTVTMSVDGGPTTTTIVNCVIAGFTGVCD